MQAFIGTAVFIVVLAVAALISIKHAEGAGLRGFFEAVFLFFVTVIGIYVVFAVAGTVLWVIWWIGIMIREILQWIVEALVYPWYWLFSHLF